MENNDEVLIGLDGTIKVNGQTEVKADDKPKGYRRYKCTAFAFQKENKPDGVAESGIPDLVKDRVDVKSWNSNNFFGERVTVALTQGLCVECLDREGDGTKCIFLPVLLKQIMPVPIPEGLMNWCQDMLKQIKKPDDKTGE